MKLVYLSLAFMTVDPSAVFAGKADLLPACAQSGASSVFFNGKPALKMSDVVNCPPELIEIIPSITIEGQPLVLLRSGTGEKARCQTRGSSNITAGGKAAQTAGDAECEAHE
ncbi:PAAR domain-containing protein [Rhizobium sp. L1K21]|uniref:PAAR domain-containing protein n=1 Tax=Rhizobium sp. L1K21 TaxID=2954933 RepID=UPI00209306FD|nr:PAAR domain-containing protein [Rhizobium sp. L1K21]MCO6186461.1 PAAR domain-containing protein [Rhizobium sp. L1K21]